MARKIPRVLWIAAPLACLSYFYRLSAVGLIGPDEPRYAAIAREMARSGDWITPRLWGQPWFEKPPLLYWMSGLAFRLGLGPELAPRLPVAVMAVAFLVFYWWILNREFGSRAAWFATLILGSTGAWLGFSQVGVTDLPLTATFSAAMLLGLPWIARRDSRFLPAASALLGCAVLAKSGVPIVLALPFLWWMRPAALPAEVPADPRSPGRSTRNWRTAWRIVLPFLVVAIPWHVFCYLSNGQTFLYTLFVQHQLQRFTSDALQHTQPAWYYLPVFAGLMLPWSPLLLLLAQPKAFRDPRRQFLLAWVVFGLVFFSLASNKLPGYVLPLIPPAVALMAITLDETARAGYWLAVCAVLLIALLVAAPLLPVAVSAGLSRAPRPQFQWTWLLPVIVAAVAWLLDRRAHRIAAVLAVAFGAAMGIVYVKRSASFELDQAASARALWFEIAARADQACVADIRRNWRYGLNYYSQLPLPECKDHAMPVQIVQRPGMAPTVVNSLPPTVDLH